jgi:hypothetical protein
MRSAIAEIWYEGDEVTVQVSYRFTGGQARNQLAAVPPGSRATFPVVAPTGQQVSVQVTNSAYAGGPPNRTKIQVTILSATNVPIPQSSWLLKLSIQAPTPGTNVAPTIVHGDVRSVPRSQRPPAIPRINFGQANATSGWTVDEPGCVEDFITVGAYRPWELAAGAGPRTLADQMTTSSGRGPTRDSPGRDKPDLVAPGDPVEVVQSWSSKTFTVGTLLGRLTCTASGTSFAAPHVAGLIALMFQYKRDLTQADVQTILRRTARHTAASGLAAGTWDPAWGYGRVDGVAALADLVTNYPPNPARTALARGPATEELSA